MPSPADPETLSIGARVTGARAPSAVVAQQSVSSRRRGTMASARAANVVVKLRGFCLNRPLWYEVTLLHRTKTTSFETSNLQTWSRRPTPWLRRIHGGAGADCRAGTPRRNQPRSSQDASRLPRNEDASGASSRVRCKGSLKLCRGEAEDCLRSIDSVDSSTDPRRPPAAGRIASHRPMHPTTGG